MNIYANLERGASESALLNILAVRGLTVASSVGLFQEAARIPTQGERAARIRRIQRIARHKLKPAPFLATQDLLGEIRRCAPGWLRFQPSRRKIAKILKFWQRWMDGPATTDPFALDFLRQLHQVEIDVNKPPHKQLRDFANGAPNPSVSSDFDCSDENLRREVQAIAPKETLLETLQHDDDVFLEWSRFTARGAIFEEYGAALFDKEARLSDLADYSGPYLIGSKPPSVVKWTRFCFLELDADRVPRSVAHGALTVGQRLRSYDGGNLGDIHHCYHLADVDVFVTSDSRLAKLLMRLPKSIRRSAVCHTKSDHSNLAAHLDEALES